ncbi:MAG: endonuclease I family protein [Vulcanimicrobiota bacterium]
MICSTVSTPISYPSLRPVARAAQDCGGSCPTDQADLGQMPPDTPELTQILKAFAGATQRPYYDEAGDAAQIQKYYGNLEPGSDSAEFYRALQRKLESSHTSPRSYSPSKWLYPWVDIHPDGNLRSVYSGQMLNAENLIRQDYWRAQSEILVSYMTSPETAGAALAILESQAAFNCEHVVPQSWYSKREPMRGDLHHLFACEPRCNSARGNLPYYDFPENEDTIRNDCGRIDHSGRHFEPEGGKGAVARATLYFLLRYPGALDDYSPRDIETLLEWHRENPVSLYEKHRNAAIEEIQGNRNPLIDHPEWADKIDFTQGLR